MYQERNTINMSGIYGETMPTVYGQLAYGAGAIPVDPGGTVAPPAAAPAFAATGGFAESVMSGDFFRSSGFGLLLLLLLVLYLDGRIIRR